MSSLEVVGSAIADIHTQSSPECLALVWFGAPISEVSMVQELQLQGPLLGKF